MEPYGMEQDLSETRMTKSELSASKVLMFLRNKMCPFPDATALHPSLPATPQVRANPSSPPPLPSRLPLPVRIPPPPRLGSSHARLPLPLHPRAIGPKGPQLHVRNHKLWRRRQAGAAEGGAGARRAGVQAGMEAQRKVGQTP